MHVRIFGPNLNDQSKGSFHVHAESCGDKKHYGPGTRYGGDRDNWLIDAEDAEEITYAIYDDQINEGASYDSCRSDIWLAPCCDAITEGSRAHPLLLRVRMPKEES